MSLAQLSSVAFLCYNLCLARALYLFICNVCDVQVDAQERKGAEIDYSKRFGESWMEAGATVETTEANASFYGEHPTYRHIIQSMYVAFLAILCLFNTDYPFQFDTLTLMHSIQP